MRPHKPPSRAARSSRSIPSSNWHGGTTTALAGTTAAGGIRAGATAAGATAGITAAGATAGITAGGATAGTTGKPMSGLFGQPVVGMAVGQPEGFRNQQRSFRYPAGRTD